MYFILGQAYITKKQAHRHAYDRQGKSFTYSVQGVFGLGNANV